MIRRKILFWVVLIGLVVSGLTACTKEGDVIYQRAPDDEINTAPMVTVLYDPGALGDMTYNDLIYEGVERTAVNNGLYTRQLSPRTKEEGLRYLSALIDQMSNTTDTTRQLLIVAGSSYNEYLRANNKRLEANPNVDLLYFETTQPLEGKGSSIHIRFYGAMYEAGAITPFFTPEVLLVAANPHDSGATDAVAGFQDGFLTDYVNPDRGEKKIFREYLSDEAGSGYTIADSTALQMMLSQPWSIYTRMIIPVCGGSSAVFRRLVENISSYAVMGIDKVNMSTSCSYSAVKHTDDVVEHCIGQWLSAEGLPKHQSLGLADGYTELVFHPANTSMWILYDSAVPEDLRQTIHEEAIRKEAEYEQ